MIIEEKIKEIQKAVDNANLTPREANILRLRYGLVNQQPLSVSKVAERTNMNRLIVRAIENKAFAKLCPNEQLRNYMQDIGGRVSSSPT